MKAKELNLVDKLMNFKNRERRARNISKAEKEIAVKQLKDKFHIHKKDKFYKVVKNTFKEDDSQLKLILRKASQKYGLAFSRLLREMSTDNIYALLKAKMDGLHNCYVANKSKNYRNLSKRQRFLINYMSRGGDLIFSNEYLLDYVHSFISYHIRTKLNAINDELKKENIKKKPRIDDNDIIDKLDVLKGSVKRYEEIQKS